MTATEIKAFFPAYEPPFCYDASYAVPTSAWLLESFFPTWKASRMAAGLWRYDRANDCDNFARSYVVAAQDTWAQQHQSCPGEDPRSRTDDEALAVGEFCYLKEGKTPHAIVCAFCEDGMIFIEPQTGEHLSITPWEFKSCFHVSF